MTLHFALNLKITIMTDTQEFQSAVAQLVGLPCWNIKAGAIGAMASIHLGEKVALDKPLPFPNTSLTPDEHKFRGAMVLYIEDCPWRLDGEDAVIASWTDSNAPKGPIVLGLQGLIGATVTAASVTPPGMDLTVQFDNGRTLRIFPDQVDADAGDNYSLSIKGGATYIVTAHSRVYKE